MKFRAIVCTLAALSVLSASAQVFTNDVWEQKNLVAIKVSQLYYEATIGANLFPERHYADFVYMAFGYGKPTKKNAWRKFMPENEVLDAWPKTLKEKLSNSSTDDLHAGMVSVGWNHWFNHMIGCYVQAGWGFIADLSTDDEFTDEEKTLMADAKEKNTFIYNTVPIELGLTLNMWKHYNIQAGITYMWKEIPLFTFGVGYVF